MAPRRRPPRLSVAATPINRGNPPKGPQETQNNPTRSAQTAPQRRSHSTQNSSDHRQPTKISSPLEKCGLEYLHYDLNNNPSQTGPISPGIFIPVRFTWTNYGAEVVRAGLNYKF